MDDEGNFIFLVASQSLGMSKKTKSGDISCPMCIVLVHQTCSNSVQTSHGIHTSLVSFANVFFTYNKFDSVPTFRLIKPLMGINGYLSSKRLGQNQDITNDSRIRNNELIWLTNSGG